MHNGVYMYNITHVVLERIYILYPSYSAAKGSGMGFACIFPPYFIVEFGAYTSHHKKKIRLTFRFTTFEWINRHVLMNRLI